VRSASACSHDSSGCPGPRDQDLDTAAQDLIRYSAQISIVGWSLLVLVTKPRSSLARSVSPVNWTLGDDADTRFTTMVALGFFAIAPFATDWNPVLRAFVLSVAVVPVAVYVVVPQLMRVYGKIRATRR